MLSKLIGYEMKAFGRILLPIYAAIVTASVLLGIDFRFFPNSSRSGATIALTVILGILIAAVFAVTVLLLIIRFYNNLLGREGYLMFSLPVGTGNLIWAKVISSVIWSILSVIASAVVVTPFLMTSDFTDAVKDGSLGKIWTSFLGEIAPYRVNIILGILLIIAGTVLAITRIYAAISIGHLWTVHRVLGAVLAFIGLGILESVLFMTTGIGLFSVEGAFGGVTDSAMQTAADVARYEGIGLAVMAAGIAIYGAVTWLILDRKLNLE